MDWGSIGVGIASNAIWGLVCLVIGTLGGWVWGFKHRNNKFYKDLDESLSGLKDHFNTSSLRKSEYECIACGDKLSALYTTHVSNYSSFKKIVVDDQIEHLIEISEKLKKLKGSEDAKEERDELVSEFCNTYFSLKNAWPQKVKSMKLIHYTIKD